MQTTQEATTPVTVGPDDSKLVRSLKTRNRWLVVAVALLVLATLGLGGLAFFGGDDGIYAPGIDGGVVDEIQALLDADAVAWSEGDADAVMATMAEDGFHISGGTRGALFRGDRLSGFADNFSFLTWTAQDPLVIDEVAVGGSTEYIVVEPVVIHPDTAGPEDADTLIVLYRIVEENGELKIAEQVSYEDIAWPRG